MLDKNLHDMIMQLGNNSVSKHNPIVTEITNEMIVTRSITDREKKEEEPVIIDLQEYARSRVESKAGSSTTAIHSSDINKVREITEIIFSNGRRV